jgi:hypothetical protein
MPKKNPQPRVKIVEYPGGRELTVAAARSGDYVIAAAADPNKLYALPSRERLLDSWARDHGVKNEVDKLRRAVAKLPADPGADVDIDAMWERIERDTDAVKKFARKRGLKMSDPKLLEEAHKARVLDSAIVYERTGFGGLSKVLSASTYNLSPAFPNGARSCRTYGYQAVRLFAQPGYKPAGGVASATRGNDIPVSPPFKSVLFI